MSYATDQQTARDWKAGAENLRGEAWAERAGIPTPNADRLIAAGDAYLAQGNDHYAAGHPELATNSYVAAAIDFKAALADATNERAAIAAALKQQAAASTAMRGQAETALAAAVAQAAGINAPNAEKLIAGVRADIQAADADQVKFEFTASLVLYTAARNAAQQANTDAANERAAITAALKKAAAVATAERVKAESERAAAVKQSAGISTPNADKLVTTGDGDIATGDRHQAAFQFTDSLNSYTAAYNAYKQADTDAANERLALTPPIAPGKPKPEKPTTSRKPGRTTATRPKKSTPAGKPAAPSGAVTPAVVAVPGGGGGNPPKSPQATGLEHAYLQLYDTLKHDNPGYRQQLKNMLHFNP